MQSRDYMVIGPPRVRVLIQSPSTNALWILHSRRPRNSPKEDATSRVGLILQTDDTRNVTSFIIKQLFHLNIVWSVT